jgi:hypothetical protein
MYYLFGLNNSIAQLNDLVLTFHLKPAGIMLYNWLKAFMILYLVSLSAFLLTQMVGI